MSDVRLTFLTCQTTSWQFSIVTRSWPWIVRHSIMLKVTWRRFDQSAKQLVVGRAIDLEIDRVERIYSTRLKSIDSIDSLPTVYRPIHFYAAQLQLSSVFFIVMSVCLSQPWTVLISSWLLDNSQTCWLARSLDPCAKTTGRIDLQFGVLIGLGQCHFVLDGCPIPNRPSVAFRGEGHSWSVFEKTCATTKKRKKSCFLKSEKTLKT